MSFTPTMRKFMSRPVTFTFDIPTDRLSQFWEGLRKGKVYASKCQNCGTLSFPPVADCYRCLHSAPEWLELQGEGEIETFTHIVLRPSSFAAQETYTVTVAKMKEGVKVLAWLTGVKLSEVRIGAKVQLTARETDEGPTYGFTLMDEPPT